MDATLGAQRPLPGFIDKSQQLNFKPFFGLRSYRPITRYSQSWRVECATHGTPCQISAAAEFSKRRQRKRSSSRSRGSGSNPKGFMPKIPDGTGTGRRQRNYGDSESSMTSTSGLDERAPEIGVDTDGNLAAEVDRGMRVKGESVDAISGKVGKLSRTGERLADSGVDSTSRVASVDGQESLGSNQASLVGLHKDQLSLVGMDNEQMSFVASEADKKRPVTLGSNQKRLVVSCHDQRSLLALGDDQESLRAVGNDQKNLVVSDNDNFVIEDEAAKSESLSGSEDTSRRDVHEIDNNLLMVEASDETNSGTVLSEISGEEVELDGAEHNAIMREHEEQTESDDIRTETEKVTQELLKHSKDTVDAEVQAEDPSHELKLKMEAQRHRQVLEELAAMNISACNKLFTYPQGVKPGQDIVVFLNRSLSTLKDEPNVMIMGAFNDWRWKSFTMKLEKTNLNGDWWSCKIHVPKEAYTIDFVFFNGKNVYDNNDRKDFHITVEEGMNAVDFEDFLLEEKRRELELKAKVQAEKGRQAEEHRRKQEEKAANEADRAQARLEVERERANLHEMTKMATISVDNLWYFEPHDFGMKDVVRLYYNRSCGPLAHAKDIWIHGGHNNWGHGLSITAKMVKSERNDADWWYAEVIVPDGALVLDWVFADGPPPKANVYDNNCFQDFHAIVPNSIPDELYWVEEEQRIYRRLQMERQAREEAIHAKAERTAQMRAKTKERTLKRFLLSQKHIVYTDPLDVEAGKDVTVYYNPANTVLNGKPEIWIRFSYNRWTHSRGPLAPQKMVPDETVSHVKAVVKVPLDVYMMDFVFSEREDGGIFDNKDGTDYHIPVFGGILKEPPMHIVHIAVEMAPIAKVGGLGDVVTGLSRAIHDLNHHVDIILPKYDCLNLSHVKDLHYQRSYSWDRTEIKVWFGKVEGLPVYFLEPCNGLFWTGCIYGCRNDGERFGFFCRAALEFLKQTGSNPDIIHCHDWSSAPVSWLFKEHYMASGLSKAHIVFTIHNLEFGAPHIGKAVAYSDKATTVSHTYSKEVAGNPAIAPHLYKFHGIVNGIDPDIWDPYNDKFIPVSYTSENVIEGKKAAKEALQRKLGLKLGDTPMVGVISRLTHQKGIHLIKHAIWHTLDCGGQVVLLGSAPDPRIQNDFVNLANQLHSTHNDHARLCLTYDEPLSHMIYAAADFILVPSIFEPCGLTQLVAMRYGAVPVVRKTGGLYDTVFDVDHDRERALNQGLEPNGFNFEGADAPGVDYALNRAISAWYDNRDWFYSLCKQVMEQDWSWNRSALEYLELYQAARKF